MTFDQIWTPTGIILGFQMTLFSWRLSEEAKVGDAGDIPWLIPSDYVNILGMLVLVIGVYLLPIMNLVDIGFCKISFGFGAFLFIGQALGTAAHYQLFNISKKRVFVWFPKQEKIVLSCFTILSVIFLIISSIK
jgi:hypothetical protein